MLCEICKKRTATTHYKQIINDSVTEMHLCSQCAANQGYSNIFGNFSSQFEKMFGSVFGVPEALPGEVRRCSSCGITLDDIVKSGRVGCTDCYTEFYDKLMPSVGRIHGNTYHIGKKPVKNIEQVQAIRVKSELEILRDEMDKAVKAEEFERAAQLRDQIRELEANEHE